MRFLMLSLIVLYVNTAVFAAQKTQSLVTIKPETKQQYLDMVALGFEIISSKDEKFTVVASEDELLRLSAKGIFYQTDIKDMTAHYQNRFDAEETMGGFMTLSEIEAYLDSLAGEYPLIMTAKFSIGKTIENRDQWAVKVSDNPGLDETEPEVLYWSLLHAREPAGAASLLYFMNHLLSNYGSDAEITDLVDNRELYFIPVMNADGYAHNETIAPSGGGMWRKNKRDNGDGQIGVDLNRNFGYKWAYDDFGSSPITASATYRGTGPFSEPETDNLRSFITGREFVILHDIHCYSNLELWPYGYDRFYTDRDVFFSNLCDSITQFNGYAPGISWTLYPTNGESTDWAWGDTLSKSRIIGLTAEIGNDDDGFWPNPARIPDLVAENVWPNLYLAKIADNPYVIGPPRAPEIIELPPVSSNYLLEWQHTDSINPAASYKLYEHLSRSSITDDAEMDNGFWGLSRMQLSSTLKHSGSFSWHEIGENGRSHWLVSQTHYEVQPDDSLKFWMWYDIEQGWDYFYAQLSTDGGLTFVNLANLVTTNDNPNGNNLGNGITGFSPGWVELKFDLAAWVGQRVHFRLAYFTDAVFLNTGVYIDDIANVEFFAGTTELILPNTDTSFNFSSKPDGDYFYEIVAVDSEDQQSGKSSYVKVTVGGCCFANRGNANNDLEDKANVSDVSYLVSWLFGIPSGPEPFCIEEANANGDVDEKANVSDVSYLVAWLFGIPSGPEPSACP